MLKTTFLTLLLITTTCFFTDSSSSAQTKNSPALVKILVASWCVHCRELESFLQKEGIGYIKLDVETDPEGRRRYHELGGGGVPLVIIGNSILRGFDREAILELLQKSNALQTEHL